MVEVDATQYYDRIVHSLAILLSKNEGTLINSLIFMFSAIQGTNYFLRTIFGNSKRSYGGRQNTVSRVMSRQRSNPCNVAYDINVRSVIIPVRKTRNGI